MITTSVSSPKLELAKLQTGEICDRFSWGDKFISEYFECNFQLLFNFDLSNIKVPFLKK